MLQDVINRILGTRSLSATLPDGFTPFLLKSDIRAILTRHLAGVFPVASPVLINISGLPASGKSVLATAFKAENPHFLYLSFDAIMEQLPPYQAEVKTDKQRAFERWELPARFIGYHVLKKAVKARLPIVFEHSNASPLHLELYEEIKKLGYTVEIRFISAEPPLVLPRLARRDRYFSPQNVMKRWETLQTLLPELQKTSDKFTFLKAWQEQ